MISIKVDSEIELILVDEKSASTYVKLASENYSQLNEWLAWPPKCKTRGDFLNFIKNSINDFNENKSMVCGIWYKSELVGNVSFNTINHELKKVEIGYWLATKVKGNGIITRICRKLIDYAFENLKMRKVQISVAIGNKASIAVCERLNMKLEGIITNSEYINGKILDHAIYGVFCSK